MEEKKSVVIITALVACEGTPLMLEAALPIAGPPATWHGIDSPAHQSPGDLAVAGDIVVELLVHEATPSHQDLPVYHH